MKLDLDSRLSLGFAFGIFGLSAELAGWVMGLDISSVLTGAFVSIILGTFGVQVLRGAKENERRNGSPARESPDG